VIRLGLRNPRRKKEKKRQVRKKESKVARRAHGFSKVVSLVQPVYETLKWSLEFKKKSSIVVVEVSI